MKFLENIEQSILLGKHPELQPIYEICKLCGEDVLMAYEKEVITPNESGSYRQIVHPKIRFSSPCVKGPGGKHVVKGM